MASHLSIVHITPDKEGLSSIETNIICEEKGCNRILPHSSALRLHYIQCHKQSTLKTSHKKGEEKWFHCPIESCIYHESMKTKGKHFSKAKYVKQHYLKVHADKNYRCTKCNKGFSTQNFLNGHLKLCGIDLTCSTCNQLFVSIESLQMHLKRFSGHSSDILTKLLREKNYLKKTKSAMKPSFSLSFSSKPILPKPEPTYVIAAIALSEMSAAGIKRAPSVEVGTQTDAIPHKKQHRKSYSPCRASEAKSRRSKQTTEMETQTRLTNLKKKVRKRSKSGSTLTNLYHSSLNKYRTHRFLNKTDKLSQFANTYHDFAIQDHCYSQVTGITDDANYIGRSLNSSGTQTSPRASLRILSQQNLNTNYRSLEFIGTENCLVGDDTLTKGFSIPGPSILKDDSYILDEKGFCSKDNIKIDHNILEESTNFSPQVVSDDENLLCLSSNDEVRFSRPPLSQIRSSSIETQTDHDVFLNTNANDHDEDVDILTSAQTQTDRDGPSYDDYINPGCSIETQTYEDFSDIEQFLCSTIHTQTHETASELFPELNLTDTQTQTNFDYSPSFVNTHTQTSIFGSESI